MPPIEAASLPQPPADPRAASPLLRIKFVYYGSAGAGKTATLRRLAARLSPSPRDRLLLFDAPGAPTLYFDQLSLSLSVAGQRVLLNLYSVPGGAMQRPMRRLLLRGADAVIWVNRPAADVWPHGSSPGRGEASPDELRDNLRDSVVHAESLPIVEQPSPFDCPEDEPLIASLRCALAALWPRAEARLAAAGSIPDGTAALAAWDDALLRALHCRRTVEHSARLGGEAGSQVAAMAAILTLPEQPAAPIRDGARPV